MSNDTGGRPLSLMYLSNFSVSLVIVAASSMSVEVEGLASLTGAIFDAASAAAGILEAVVDVNPLLVLFDGVFEVEFFENRALQDPMLSLFPPPRSFNMVFIPPL